MWFMSGLCQSICQSAKVLSKYPANMFPKTRYIYQILVPFSLLSPFSFLAFLFFSFFLYPTNTSIGPLFVVPLQIHKNAAFLIWYVLLFLQYYIMPPFPHKRWLAAAWRWFLSTCQNNRKVDSLLNCLYTHYYYDVFTHYHHDHSM